MQMPPDMMIPPQQAGSPSDYVYEEAPAYVSDEVWKLLLNRSPIARKIAHSLAGEMLIREEDEKGNVVERYVGTGEPYINKRGVLFFATLIESCTSADKIATFITDEEVRIRCLSFRDNVIFIIAERHEDFGIDPAHWSLVLEIIEDFYFFNLTASRQGTILKALKHGVERKEIYTPMPKQKQGLKLPFFGGGRR